MILSRIVTLVILFFIASCKPKLVTDSSLFGIEVDLSSQFPDPPTRNQCNTGSCQSFAAIALYENALLRQFGVKVRLSEGHLYAELLFANMDILKRVVNYLNDTKNLNSFAVSEAFNSVTGEYIQTAVRRLLDKGIGFEETAPFDQFVTRFQQFRPTYEEIILSCLKSSREIGTTQEMFGDEKVCSLFGAAQVESLLGGSSTYKKLQHQASIISNSVLRQIAIAKNPHEQEISELSALVRSGKQPRQSDCFFKGRKAFRNIMYHLEKKRPVAVSMYINGVAGFGNAGKHAVHAFVITGGKSDGRRVTFSTRNSWGGKNPPIFNSDMCRVLDVVALTIPKERKVELPNPVELLGLLDAKK